VIPAIKAAQPLTIDVLYGDFEGGQRMTRRFMIEWVGDNGAGWVGHHWNRDRPDPR
jgi:hypothetical protein